MFINQEDYFGEKVIQFYKRNDSTIWWWKKKLAILLKTTNRKDKRGEIMHDTNNNVFLLQIKVAGQGVQVVPLFRLINFCWEVIMQKELETVKINQVLSKKQTLVIITVTSLRYPTFFLSNLFLKKGFGETNWYVQFFAVHFKKEYSFA